jgi:2-hydroxycyclohexanecarboxyl-CoA dehydrogenase
MNLKDKGAIITGAGIGIGRSIALKFAENGGDVAIVDRNIETAENTAEEAKKWGRKTIAINADVTDRTAVEAMVGQVLGEFGRIDILVNNAGWSKPQPFLEQSQKSLERLIDVNLKGVIYCCRAVLDHMVAHKRGKIINISSQAGIVGVSWQEVYSATKGGVISLTKSLAKEFGKYNINVNSVAPGITKTPALYQGIKISKDFARQISDREKAIPLGRAAEVEDIANAVVFFASSMSDYITGQVLMVNGGEFM